MHKALEHLIELNFAIDKRSPEMVHRENVHLALVSCQLYIILVNNSWYILSVSR